MTQPIYLPTIHLNGTGANSLRDEYNKVRLAAKATADALADATCNGRYFYPQGPEALQQAQAERREMFRLLELVYNYAEQWQARAADNIR